MTITRILHTWGWWYPHFTEEEERKASGEIRKNEEIGLRTAMWQQTPLVYFYGIAEGVYEPIFPAYIVGDEPERLTFSVAVGEMRPDAGEVFYTNTEKPMSYIIREEAPKRAYITAQVRQRLFQGSFREMIMRAYGEQCAFCRLRHLELLDAAHIIPDQEDEGEPVVRNGMALCKIHHAAFDHHLVGVRPDYRIEVRRSVLEENDGLMLQYGIQALHGGTLLLPRRKADYPEAGKVQWRYEKFLAMG